MIRTTFIVALTTLGAAYPGPSTSVSPVWFASATSSERQQVPMRPKPARPIRTRAVELLRADDGLFYATFKANNIPVRFLIDTGSSVVVLTRSDAQRIGALRNGQIGTIATVGGQTRMRWSTVRHIEIGDQRVEKVDVAIVEDDLKVSLLGQNLLTRLGSIRIEGDRIKLSAPNNDRS